MSNIIIPGSPIGDQQLATYAQATLGWLPVQIGNLPYKLNVSALAPSRTKAYLITKAREAYATNSNAWGVVGSSLSDCNATTSSDVPVPSGDILSNGISVSNGTVKFPHNGIYQINITVPMEIKTAANQESANDVGRLRIASSVYCPETHDQSTGGGMQTVLTVNRKIQTSHFMHLNYIAAVMNYSEAILNIQAYCPGLNSAEDGYEVRVHNPEVYIAEVC